MRAQLTIAFPHQGHFRQYAAQDFSQSLRTRNTLKERPASTLYMGNNNNIYTQ